MNGALALVPMAAEPPAEWRTSYALPELDLTPLSLRQLYAWFKGGAPQADVWEEGLVNAARAKGALEVAIAEGLHAICQRDRLTQLGCHLDDYAREVLDLGKRSAENLVRLGGALRTRPLLRQAMRSGEVKLRAGQTVLSVAQGEEEAKWVERASGSTVRALEAALRRVGKGEEELEEDWFYTREPIEPAERALVDAGLGVARDILPGAGRTECMEAIAQELLAELPGDPDADEKHMLGRVFRRVGPGKEPRRAALERETERWALLPAVADLPSPEVSFPETATAQEIDATLRELAKLLSSLEDMVAYGGYAVKTTKLYERLGFTDFRHYVEERLGVPPRAVEQRVVLEEKVWKSPALQEARRQKVPYEKLRLLAKLKEEEILTWIPRAKGLTCIELRRRLEGDRERQTRASRRIELSLPRQVAVVVAAAIRAIRESIGGRGTVGMCLAVMASRFIDTWGKVAKRSRSRSRKIRERDGGLCQVPGCSHPGTHTHHIVFRSHGGGNEPEKLVAVCPFHHLRCIHGGWLRVFGRAPDQLTWFLGGKVWKGPGQAVGTASRGGP